MFSTSHFIIVYSTFLLVGWSLSSGRILKRTYGKNILWAQHIQNYLSAACIHNDGWVEYKILRSLFFLWKFYWFYSTVFKSWKCLWRNQKQDYFFPQVTCFFCLVAATKIFHWSFEYCNFPAICLCIAISG